MTTPELNTNFWGHKIPKPQHVVDNPRLRPFVEALLLQVADLLGLDAGARRQFVVCAFESTAGVADQFEFERMLKSKLVVGCDRTMMKAALRERSRIVFDEIKQVSTGKTLLDVGCGDGIVAQMLNPRFSEILLTDVANYVDRDVQLPFLPYMEGGRLPVEKSLDTVLLLTVLHHASDPLTLLRESWRATAKRLVIIETVFGVHEQPPTGHYELADFDESDQIAFAVFVDWLYNRVLHDDVPTPYNFTTPQRWLDTFAELGMRVAELKNLGQDIQIVPELHYLFVLER